MGKKLGMSLRNINYRLFAALLVLGLCPTVYTTLRVYWIGQLPSEYAYSIAGQLTWIDLLYEILSEAIILPLFFFIGQVSSDKQVFANRMRTGMLLGAVVSSLLSACISIWTEPLLGFMAADDTILAASAEYIRLESIGNIFSMLFSFSLVGLVSLGKGQYVYILTGVKLALCTLLDTFLCSTLPFSLQLGINGIAVSNILVNLGLFCTVLAMLRKEGIRIFQKGCLSFRWMKDFLKIGGISGLESLVRNAAYMLMVSRMVNMVGEQGTYWVANSFIWGWLLLPVTQLAELIKQEVASDENAVRDHSLGYFGLTAGICLVWIISIPLWKPFLHYVLGYEDVDKLFTLVLVLLGFYILYAFQNVFDATFYGLGKTNYMLFESVITNSIYYGSAFILYLTGVWTPSLMGIAILFGIGNAFDSLVSLGVYRYMLKKRKINILAIQAHHTR